MKTRLLIIFVLGIIGFTGISFAEESPGSPIPEPEQESFTYTNCGPGTTYQDGICVVDEIGNSTKSSSGKWDTSQSIDQKSNSDVIPPPLKQMQLGIKLGHVICDKDKNLVWNTHYKPSCVYFDTESELIKRGWAKLRLMLPAGPDPIKELDWMGRNVMSMMLEGTFSYNSTPVETLDEKRAAIWEYSEQYHQGEKYLEYAIIPHQNYYNVGEKVQFDLLEWGNYHDCWNLKLRIIDRHDEYVYEDNSVRYCLEPDGTPGTYHSYSMGKQFDEFVCEQPGYYRIELSNVDVFPPTILQNFACLESESDVVDSLKIPNAERDTKLAAGYKLYPGVGWVHPDDLGNQQPIYRDNPNKPEELILDLDAMIKAKESERLSQVLRLCENTDAQYLGALSFENSTHHIDSQTCTWKLLDEN